jgi:hypothetical protein
MLYLIPVILTPTILFSIWLALWQDTYGSWTQREDQRTLLQKQFYQNHLD